jgi:hypothetical protein
MAIHTRPCDWAIGKCSGRKLGARHDTKPINEEATNKDRHKYSIVTKMFFF